MHKIEVPDKIYSITTRIQNPMKDLITAVDLEAENKGGDLQSLIGLNSVHDHHHVRNQRSTKSVVGRKSLQLLLYLRFGYVHCIFMYM